MNHDWKCKTILCVDDEESVLDSYRRVLLGGEDDRAMSEILSLAREREGSRSDDSDERMMFNLLLAGSGEEAIDLVKQELAAGREVAAGFFDMRMPGGMDGYETIRNIRALDEKVICAVVTAYTDRSVTQIRNLFTFEHQDELLYFKKPFSPEELEQSAINMVSAWNLKRKNEEHVRAIEKNKRGLSQILHAIGTLASVPPHSLPHLVPGLLFQLLGIVEGDDGYAVLYDFGEETFCYGVGRFDDQNNLEEIMNSSEECKKAFDSHSTFVDDCMCFLPLQSEERILGGIYIESDHPIGLKFDLALLNVFRNQIIQLVFNSLYHHEIVKKEQEVVTDPLTGLYNRRFLMRRLKEEMCRAARHNMQISVVMLDLDDFKRVNDTYGHNAGDFVLEKVGKILRSMVREYDILGMKAEEIGVSNQYAVRYGGEEFCLVLLQTDHENAMMIAERIRTSIEDYDFLYHDLNIKVTTSCGIYTGEIPEKTSDTEQLLTQFCSKADKALYEAKESGKNRVVFYKQ